MTDTAEQLAQVSDTDADTLARDAERLLAHLNARGRTHRIEHDPVDADALCHPKHGPRAHGSE